MVPHGVMPVPQLFSVPRAVAPVGSNLVDIKPLMLAISAAGPLIRTGVCAVTLLFNPLSTLYVQPVLPLLISTRLTPW